jgi:hypothetical protein
MKNIDKEDIPELASRIPFEQLSESEQERVISLVGTPQIYTSLGYSAEKSREILTSEYSASPSINKAPAALHHALQQRSQLSSALLFKPIPLYQAALAAAATIACIFFMLPQQKTTNTVVSSLPAQPTIIVQTINKDSLVSLIRDSLQYVLVKKGYKRENFRNVHQKNDNDYEPSTEHIAYNDTIIEKQKNPFVGLDNMDMVLSQKKGMTSNAHYAVAKFAYRPRTER